MLHWDRCLVFPARPAPPDPDRIPTDPGLLVWGCRLSRARVQGVTLCHDTKQQTETNRNEQNANKPQRSIVSMVSTNRTPNDRSIQQHNKPQRHHNKQTADRSWVECINLQPATIRTTNRNEQKTIKQKTIKQLHSPGGLSQANNKQRTTNNKQTENDRSAVCATNRKNRTQFE